MNASVPISFKEAESLIFFKLPHSAKALSAITVTFLGMTISVMRSLPAKASLPIEVIESGSVISHTTSQSLNAPAPIFFMPLGSSGLCLVYNHKRVLVPFVCKPCGILKRIYSEIGKALINLNGLKCSTVKKCFIA